MNSVVVGEDVRIMQTLVNDVHAHPEKWYKCNRGPRPSAALLVLSNSKQIAGMVVPPDDSPSCLEAGCMIEWHANSASDAEDGKIYPHCVRNTHAEVDAILAAARFGVETVGATIYSINKPCYACSLAIAKAGISKIVYGWAAYDEPRTRAVLQNAGVEIVRVIMEEPKWQES